MLKKINDNDQKMIHQWRNHPEVRSVMFSDHEISWNEHLAWWNKTKTDGSKKMFLFSDEGQELGVVSFFDINAMNKTCHWGFYFGGLENLNEKKRFNLWQLLEKEAVDHAFRVIGVEKLICETFEFNKAALLCHFRNGFVETGTYHKVKQGENIKVIETTLSRKDWLALENKSKPNPKSKINAGQQCDAKKEPLLLMVYGSTNLDFLKANLRNEFSSYAFSVNYVDIPFGQQRIQLYDPESNLRKSNPDLVIFFERLEDMGYTDSGLSENQRNVIVENWNEYIESIKFARQFLSGVFLVSTITNIDYVKNKFFYNDETVLSNSFINELNKKLLEEIANLPDVYLIDMSNLMSQVGQNHAHPRKYWYLARAPFSHAFSEIMSQRIIGAWLALKGKTARVIVLDLDNTLWGGVIGDDGLSGIALGDSYPGNVFIEIQTLFDSLSKQGFVLAICSKNTEKVAIEVFEQHPGMILKEESFVSKKINWLPKSENIKSISNELDIGLGNICFIDDNPIEREEIRLLLPDVYVPELPVEISDWPEFIKKLPELTTLVLTDEDRKKTEQYTIRQRIIKSQLSATSRDEFLYGLNMKLSFELLNKLNQQRIVQLIFKTNQFNTRTCRYNENELLKLTMTGSVWGIRIKDRLGSDEIIGVLIVQPKDKQLVIDNFLLSCRVLGRGLDVAILSWCVTFALNNGYDFVLAEINRTEKNVPVHDLYTKNGFKSIGNNMYQIETDTDVLKMPGWIEIIDNV